jgi:hypothetical protein
VLREWRRKNPDRVAAYNEARRIPPSQPVCVECGERFEGQRGPARVFAACKDARYALSHTYASWAIAAGVGLFELFRLMGTSLGNWTEHTDICCRIRLTGHERR